ncbi:hypothetical protein SNOG_05410 [Parastagonospora nodorum SN15]|uniref:R3H domain-containing protein n=1 Tax=Phaeosphaeria nodorum (strain SN15 / ATCC MYA-4574 / FGSC 10173) TaxID=321614 RepID=Q0US54_PHANO|nr:hypothetical protein SNOG_05410 [Parastagonospora nodorum SN15]EAT87801.2 hypothetical protein SNOG_05410 [Parastagonospora nodorum SN15]
MSSSSALAINRAFAAFTFVDFTARFTHDKRYLQCPSCCGTVSFEALFCEMNGETKARAENHSAKSTDGKVASIAARTGEWTDAAVQSAAPSSDIKEDVPTGTDRPQSIALMKVAAAEDSSTQVSSSDGSGKPPSIDGKSVASANTFALDEKESLRPDDSASLRAVEEEDVTSPPDSVVADSRHGSDTGATRAFHDQLREIAVMNPQHRGVPVGRFPALQNGAHTLYDPNQLANGARPTSQPAGNIVPRANGEAHPPAIPDDKLLEALNSPRDRLFIVKLEQDFIDFIKETRLTYYSESEYDLPNCNTFYRMLAHRLADYYLLGHTVDSTMTGVKITPTEMQLLTFYSPPPISQMVDPAKGASTPPVELPVRKIMRRDDGKSGNNTAGNSQSASKTTSENGGSEGSNDGNDKEKDKSRMTREEREAHYKLVRLKIFGSSESEENDKNVTPDGTGSGEEKGKEISRSSSAAGKKKGRKQRNYDDDEFHSRSSFNVYYPQQPYSASGYSGDSASYYSVMPGSVPPSPYSNMNAGSYTGMTSGPAPPQAYSNVYPGMVSQDPQAQFGWPGQQYQPPGGSAPYQGPGPMQGGYDLSAQYQRGMPFQNAGMPSQITPKMGNASMVPYQDPYQQAQPMPMNNGWSPGPQQPSYPMAQGSYPPSGNASRPVSAPHQAPTYPYGQFPPHPYNGRPNHNQHPIPGSYNRPQFNPQSQTFIPGGPHIPYQQQMHGLQGNMHHQAMGPGHNQQHQMPRMVPSATSTPSFGSPQSINNFSPAMHRNVSQPIDKTHSSIAKYGTPSNLPQKPPAPVAVAQQAPKLH